MNINSVQQNRKSLVGRMPTFTAVNERIMKIAKDEYSIMNTVSGDTIELLQYKILTKKISAQDGLDTIKSIKPMTKNKYHKLYIPLIEACNTIKSKISSGGNIQ